MKLKSVPPDSASPLPAWHSNALRRARHSTRHGMYCRRGLGWSRFLSVGTGFPCEIRNNGWGVSSSPRNMLGDPSPIKVMPPELALHGGGGVAFIAVETTKLVWTRIVGRDG